MNGKINTILHLAYFTIAEKGCKREKRKRTKVRFLVCTIAAIFGMMIP